MLQGGAPATEDERLLQRRLTPAFLETDPWRALRILSEFVEGFDAMARVGPAVTIFGSARTERDDPIYELARSIAATAFIGKARVQHPSMLDLLQDLTHRIPDDTALEKLSISQGSVILVGQSLHAPALIGLLQPSSLLQSPALAGAVQTDPRTGRDRFTLTATVAGTVKEDDHGQPTP